MEIKFLAFLAGAIEFSKFHGNERFDRDTRGQKFVKALEKLT